MPAHRKRSPARRTTKKRPARRPARRNRVGLSLRGLVRAPFSLRLPELEQRQRDVLGFAAIALGVYMCFVLYSVGGSPSAGGLGGGLSEALGWCVGKARVLAPLALIAAGGVLLARPLWPRPLRAGLMCVAAAITTALAAGTFGAGPGPNPKTGESSWSGVFLQAHGGVIGEAIYQVSRRLVQNVGVDILVLFLALAGISLLTAISPARVVRAAAARTSAIAALLGHRLARARSSRGRTAAQARASSALAHEPLEALALDALASTGGSAMQLEPPDPEPSQLVVRATHVEAPSQDRPEPAGADAATSESAPGDGDEHDPGAGAHEPAAAAGRQAGGVAAAADDSQERPAEAIAGVAATDPEDDLTPRGRYRDARIADPDFVWKLPEAARLLTRSTGEQARPDTAGAERIAASLTEALGHFGVEAKVIGTVAGPHITRYELRLAPGTKVAKVAQLKDDLAYALAATEIRILAPIPGKQAVGVEVPNLRRRIVRLGDVFQQPPPDWSPLTVWLGKDVAGKAIGADLSKMPHLLVAGTTGAGKSGAINAMLCSVLLRATPHDVRLVLVDPKQVELNHYESIPHLLTPVITSPRMAANALQNLVKEMEQRYGTMSLARTRSLVELNKARARRGEAPLPYILCVIDELADLMMVAPADVEDSIIRLAQKARAVGIHLVLATQSPRVDVITGMIKANVPSRIAFAVSSQTDSRVILDQNGAESLLGQGDMLFSPVGSSRLQRIQGAYIDEQQIAKLTELWRRQGEPELREELLEQVEPSEPEGEGGDELDPDEDPLLADAITLVAEMGTASTSMLQRRLRLGYTRAGRLIDMLERRGVISGYEGSKPRQVLVSEADLPRVLASLTEPPARAAASVADGRPDDS